VSEYIPYTILSMVAEIGGLAGIMIGFSILDFINLCDNAKQIFNVLQIWK